MNPGDVHAEHMSTGDSKLSAARSAHSFRVGDWSLGLCLQGQNERGHMMLTHVEVGIMVGGQDPQVRSRSVAGWVRLGCKMTKEARIRLGQGSKEG
eukprot:316834-Pelagomonas_calceolata.AAC.1